jgi:hypothetical protein
MNKESPASRFESPASRFESPASRFQVHNVWCRRIGLNKACQLSLQRQSLCP